MNRGTRRFSNASAAFVLACLVATMALGSIRAPVANAQPEAPHCIGGGTDLNELYGISDQIVAPFCLVANAGQQWIATSRWFVKREFEEIPVGFVPAGDTPLEDAMAKFLGVTYLIDGGTKQERSIFLPNDGNLFSIDLGGGDFPVLVSPNTLGTVHPLSVGTHTVELYWSFSALHCDGGPSIADNCLAAGDHLFQEVMFEVVPGHFE